MEHEHLKGYWNIDCYSKWEGDQLNAICIYFRSKQFHQVFADDVQLNGDCLPGLSCPGYIPASHMHEIRSKTLLDLLKKKCQYKENVWRMQ